MRVLAALSGGVDSAVAAALAQEAGHEVTAVHMALSSNQQASRCGSRGCCTVEDAQDAAQAATMLGIPFYVWDMAETFHETVISDFLNEYRQGRTPNPCVRCNEFVKFRELLARGKDLGFDAVCTGHYARMLPGKNGMELHRAKCLEKDQSYVLAVMGEENLSNVIFPLGEFTSKAEVRAEAAKRHLPMSYKPDSYDICFIPDGDTSGFLRSHLGEEPGEIVDENGEVLGSHSGAYQYTVGQRKGLGITRPAKDGKPRYVLGTDIAKNRVFVGAKELLSVNRINCSQAVLLTSAEHSALRGETTVSVQYRAHGQVVPARVHYQANSIPDKMREKLGIQLDSASRRDSSVQESVLVDSGEKTDSDILNVSKGSGSLIVELLEPTRAVAPGQSLVVYSGSQVLVEATIEEAYRV